MKKDVTPTTITWRIEGYLNGETIVQFNGVGLKDEGISGIFTWNKNNYFPPVTDILDPFIGEAVITSWKIPLPKQESMKCVHGMPFYDGESNIKEMWVGVSDNINSTDSIAPMVPYKTFCNRCLEGCNIGCDKTCLDKHPDDFELIDVVVGNLSLIPTTVETAGFGNSSELQATTYYLNVKTVNFAAQETLVQSEGIMVDTTPPDLQYIHCIDPSNSMEEPSDYQGTNSSMGAYWECSEDVGDIVDYTIQIGTRPGGSDIKSPVSVGFAKKLKVDRLGDKLQHEHTYYFTVTVRNSAGLTAQKSCSITVEIEPPDVTNVTLSYMFSDDEMEETALTAEDTDIGLEWAGGKQDVAFYEWEIGSEPETDDVFPRIKVGITESRRAFIKDGRLWIDNTRLNASVGDFANKTEYNESMHYTAVDTFFHLEPGKCVYVTLYAVGRSHLSSTVHSSPLCVKRKTDTEVEIGTQVHNRKRKGGGLHGEMKLQDSQTGVSADVIIKGRDIRMLGGVLNQTDVTADYGTAASYKYLRYLVDPSTTLNKTSRFLRNRLKKYSGLMLYLSPSASLESLTEISISVEFDQSLYDTNTDLPALIYWDKDEQKWKHPQDVCDDVVDQTDFVKGMLYAKACKEIFKKLDYEKSQRKKRSVQEPKNPVPRMWSLMVMSRRAPNTHPVITTADLFIGEDMFNITTLPNGRTLNQSDSIHDINGLGVIQYFDSENDQVEFSIVHQPLHGFANITTDGSIFYRPNKDFNGVDHVTIMATETGLLPPFHPLSSTKNITIHISPTNDAPEILPFESSLIFDERERQGKIIVDILFDGNVTKKYDIGEVTIYDADFVDPSINEINFTSRTNNSVLHKYTINQIPNNGILKKKLKVELSLDKTFYGRTTLNVRAFDNDKFTSKGLDINAYIMIAPCIHGNCANKTSTPCSSKERATSFEKYLCECDVGYTGEWCETDINECEPNPCTVFYDCENLIGYQKCNLNIPKTFLLTLAVGLMFVMIGLLVRRFYKKKRPNKIDPGKNIWDFGFPALGQQKKKYKRPATADSTSEFVGPTTSGAVNIEFSLDDDLDYCLDSDGIKESNKTRSSQMTPDGDREKILKDQIKRFKEEDKGETSRLQFFTKENTSRRVTFNEVKEDSEKFVADENAKQHDLLDEKKTGTSLTSVDGSSLTSANGRESELHNILEVKPKSDGNTERTQIKELDLMDIQGLIKSTSSTLKPAKDKMLPTLKFSTTDDDVRVAKAQIQGFGNGDSSVQCNDLTPIESTLDQREHVLKVQKKGVASE